MKNPESHELTRRDKKNMNDGTHVAGPTGDEPAELRKRLAEAECELARLRADLDTARESGEYFRQIVESISDVIFEVDNQGRVIYLSPMMKAIWGNDPEEILGKNFLEIVHPEDRTLLAQRFMELGAGVEYPLVYRIRNKAGEFKWVRTRTKPRMEAGRFRKATGTLIDITEQKKAEDELHLYRQRLETLVQDRTEELEAVNSRLLAIIAESKKAQQDLRASEEKYRLLAENATDVIWTMSLDGRFTYVSPSVTMHAGYSQEEAMAMTIESYMHKDDLPWVMEMLLEEMQKPREERSQSRILQLRQNSKDGSILNVEVSVSWLYDEQGEIVGLQGSTRDITARRQAEETRRKLEERLAQAQRIESIGTLAGGIAHDFNNLLMGIQGYASLMLIDLNADHPHYEKLRAIEKQVASGADLTRQLLGFARGGRYDIKTTDINELLAATAALFGRTKKEIRIHAKYAGDLHPADVDRGQMEQALLNIFINAWQAMPGGGDIFLETENACLDHAVAASHEIPPGAYLRIRITDTGTGMDEKTRQRVFDPFFTTRTMGRGTGLGLATVYGILKGHGGFVHVDSEPGHGTTFSLYLPASEKTVTRTERVTDIVRGGTETILLVDDEQIILDVGREMLGSLGYRVWTEENGENAAAFYRNKGREIDLVILDMIMPGLSGGETYDQLRIINPNVRVLLSSGYSIDGMARQIMDRGCNGFLQKPFRLEELSRKIREILGDRTTLGIS